MIGRVHHTVAEYRMVAAGDTVVVAVSGGVDSMVLLHVLAALRDRLGLRLHAAHLDHGLRGMDGQREAAAVAEWAARLDVPVTLERAGPLERGGGSLQRAARAARYAFLERVADRVEAARIAIGHHRDDVAETVLLNLLRGAGLRGLAGIPPVRGRVIRPLLEIPRERIVAYARSHRVPWMEDPSNRSDAYRRNRIRAELIPILAGAYNPRISEVLARTAAIIRSEDGALDALARRALSRLTRPAAEGEAALRGAELVEMDRVERRRVLRAAVETLPGRPILSAGHLAALEAWAAAGPRPSRCDFLRGVASRWEGEDLILAPKASPHSPQEIRVPLGVPTRAGPFAMTFFAELAGPVAADPQPAGPGPAGPLPSGPEEAWLDAAAAPDGLAVRGWHFGDRFRPLGLAGSKKLQDFFVDAKVPRAARARVPIVVSGDRILWVVGHRIDERAKITAATQRALRITARPDPPGA